MAGDGMNYYKSVINGYIEFIGEGNGGTSITKDEYDNIMSVIKNRPMDDGLSYYRLKEDLSWEKLQVESEDTPPVSNEESQYTQELETALEILGVEVG